MKKLFLLKILVLALLSTSLLFSDVLAEDCGPSGGKGGYQFQDSIMGGYEVAEVRVRSGTFIDAIQLAYRRAGSNMITHASEQHGGNTGNPDVFTLGRNEYIVAIGGKYGDFVDSLWIKTNRGRGRKWGGSGGNVHFHYTVPEGWMITGFFGRAGQYLDAIGIVYKPARW